MAKKVAMADYKICVCGPIKECLNRHFSVRKYLAELIEQDGNRHRYYMRLLSFTVFRIFSFKTNLLINQYILIFLLLVQPGNSLVNLILYHIAMVSCSIKLKNTVHQNAKRQGSQTLKVERRRWDMDSSTRTT